MYLSLSPPRVRQNSRLKIALILKRAGDTLDGIAHLVDIALLNAHGWLKPEDVAGRGASPHHHTKGKKALWAKMDGSIRKWYEDREEIVKCCEGW